ncbi:hypothetical protein ACFVY4_33620 [Streptomyces sp. NPDC058299]
MRRAPRSTEADLSTSIASNTLGRHPHEREQLGALLEALDRLRRR